MDFDNSKILEFYQQELPKVLNDSEIIKLRSILRDNFAAHEFFLHYYQRDSKSLRRNIHPMMKSYILGLKTLSNRI